jgi:CubicO group peptidase (beta-lactamase class C family)
MNPKLLFILTALSSAGPLATQQLPTAMPQDVGMSADRFRELDDSLRSLVDEGLIPGAVLLVARHGRVAHLARAGYADLESRTPVERNAIFRLASATKIWMSVAVLTLVEEGKVGLDSPVHRYLPEFGNPRVAVGGAPVSRIMTVRDLLRHTDGYGYGFSGAYQKELESRGLITLGGSSRLTWSHTWSLEEWSRRLAGVPMEAEPGTKFSYGFGHDLLGALVERVAGQRLDEFFQQRLLAPLGLGGTGFHLEPARLQRLTSFYRYQDGGLHRVETAAQSPFARRPRALSGGGGWDNLGNGGLVSTADDFARLLQMLLNGGELNGVRILRRETVAEMFRNQLEGIGTGESFWSGAGFGFGCAVLFDPARFQRPGERGKMWWAGSTNVHFWMEPSLGLSAVLMTHVLPFGHADVMDRVQRWTYRALRS